MRPLELWGGHECSVNRIGDRFHDQTLLTRHHQREQDLELFAQLGLRTLRYPLLWERTAPDEAGRHDWSWSDRRLSRMQALAIKPILGLVHHGSGPRYTNLLDPGFAEGLGRFAGAAAERYPHVTDWTPVNEPLTTARFSALYGHWSPHLRDETAFWTALLNQVDGIRAAMAAVRRVNPASRLIQTEDLGRTYATGALAGQAAFDNARRWMTWDLLSGAVVPGHALWDSLAAHGLDERLRVIADAPCPPDVIGVNHYVTSDRFLDHRLERYPPHVHGGNGRQAYADVEAVRAVAPAPAGLGGVLLEAWERYGAPIAVTESHLGSTRDEQLRWLREAWETAQELRKAGANVEAVTAWSLLGAYDWDSLLTAPRGAYEVGAFDISSGRPRATAVARAIRDLCNGRPIAEPAAQGEGWWRRDIRLTYAPVRLDGQNRSFLRARPRPPEPARPLLVTGASGALGQGLARACIWRGIDLVLTDRATLDLADPESIAQTLDTYRPWAVINAAGWMGIEEAEADPEGCFAANATGALNLATACRRRGKRFVGVSSDLVFNGKLGRPYVEHDLPAPLNAYGRSKLEAERGIRALGGCALMVRTAAFFCPFDLQNFAAGVRRALIAGEEVLAAHDLTISPTYVPDLADAVLDLVIDGEQGVWHLANGGSLSWAQFAARLASALGYPADQVRAAPAAAFGWAAARPSASPLASVRGAGLPPLDHAIHRFAEQAAA